MNRPAESLSLNVCILLVACSGKEPESAPTTEHKALYKEIKAPLDKASGVEQQLQEGADQRLKDIDRQEDERSRQQ